MTLIDRVDALCGHYIVNVASGRRHVRGHPLGRVMGSELRAVDGSGKNIPS